MIVFFFFFKKIKSKQIRLYFNAIVTFKRYTKNKCKNIHLSWAHVAKRPTGD